MPFSTSCRSARSRFSGKLPIRETGSCPIAGRASPSRAWPPSVSGSRLLVGCRAGVDHARAGEGSRAHHPAILWKRLRARSPRDDRLSGLLLPFPDMETRPAVPEVGAVDDRHRALHRRRAFWQRVFRPNDAGETEIRELADALIARRVDVAPAAAAAGMHGLAARRG